MARRATLRASDEDREQIAERLRRAAGEGRIVAEELEERLETVFSARTYGELDAVVADLPGTPARRPDRTRTPALPRPAVIVALVFLLPVLVSMLIAAVVVITTVAFPPAGARCTHTVAGPPGAPAAPGPGPGSEVR
jgi:hypothetical protein